MNQNPNATPHICFLCHQVKKIIYREQLSNRESLFVALAIDNAFKALRNEISATDDIVSSLRPYFFTINKLHSVFSPLLEEIDD